MYSPVRHSQRRRPQSRCPSRSILWIRRIHLDLLTHSSHLINRSIPCLIQDLHLHRMSASRILLRILHQPDQNDRPDPPIPPAPPGVRDKPGGESRSQTAKAVNFVLEWTQSTGGDVTLPSQSQPSQPILPTVVVPSPHEILTNPEEENDDEELELPNLEQEETIAPPVLSSSSKKQKTGKKKKPGENPDDEDSPGSSLRNEPAASSNFNPNNPVNLPMQSGSEEELLPHVPTSSGAGSSQRTMQDREEDESEDSQRTRQYDDQEADLVLDEAHWSLMTSDQKICANTGSFTVARDIEGNPVLLGRVKGTFKPSNRCGFSHQKHTDKDHVDRLCKNMTDDDRALLVLYLSKQESLKASTTSARIGRSNSLKLNTSSANLGLTMKCST